ncbi:MAG TPA: disulfide bond formation protein B [Caulobacterales bacterium]|nr:disulfide bond formation protein B [Caulobacterales bacterium]
MQNWLSSLRPRWPFAALLVSGALLAGAHAFETFGKLLPCEMCLEQRERHWWIVGAALVLLVLGLFFRKRVAWYAAAAAAVLGLLYVWSFVAAAHHVAVEQHWMIATCDAVRDASQIRTIDFSGTFETPRCDVPQWSLFGVTMAGYNAIISAAMAVLSLAVILARPKVSA